jgi:hypothetical protein
MRLARIITKEVEPQTIPRVRIIERIKQEFNAGRFDRNKFTGKASGNLDLVVNFFRDRTIDFSSAAQTSDTLPAP